MRIYKDKFSGDELFSDSLPMQLVNGVVYKVKGKLRTETFDIDEKAIGGNASAEGGGEGTETTLKQGVDIVLNSRLCEFTMNKKDYLTYIKGYMKTVKDRLTEEKSTEVDLFQKNIKEFMKEVVDNFGDYQFFCGESMNPDCMLALMKWDEETPYMYFFKHGLDEEKV